MKSVGLFEAKTKFSALIHSVSAGETILVTRNGKPVAELSPVHQEEDPGPEIAQRIRALRKHMNLKGVDIRSLIYEDRK